MVPLEKHIPLMPRNVDFYFFEELHRTVGQKESFNWLLSQTSSSLSDSPARSPRFSSARSACRSPCSGSQPNSPRGRPENLIVAAKEPVSTPRHDAGQSKLLSWSSFSELDLQSLKVSEDHATCGSKLGLLFTDAAHSILDE